MSSCLRATVSAHQAIDMLDSILSYRQLDYWIRVRMLDISEPAHGSGTVRALDLIDVLRFRAMGLIVESLSQAWSLRDIAYEVRQATDLQLVSALTMVIGRLQIRIDLTVNDDEQSLAKWIQVERPALAGIRS